MSYLLLIPLLLILFVLLKKKSTDKKIPSNDIQSPYTGAFNGIVTFEDKIKNLKDSLNEDSVKDGEIITIHQNYPIYFYRVAVFVYVQGNISNPGYYNVPAESIRDFTSGDLIAMRKEAIAYYNEQINNNKRYELNPVNDFYDHVPLSKYKLLSRNTIAVAIYLVAYNSKACFTEYLIGGDEMEYTEKGRAFEATLFDEKN